MSKFGEFTTIMTDERFLVAALSTMGYEVETHPNGAYLFGYLGDERPENAHVIIRRRQLDSASNDIGFARTTNGRFVAVLSEYDRQIGYDDAWLGKVQQIYKEKQTIAVAKAKGYIFHGREVIKGPNGKEQIRLRFGVRS
jgi:hypothetical protein